MANARNPAARKANATRRARDIAPEGVCGGPHSVRPLRNDLANPTQHPQSATSDHAGAAHRDSCSASLLPGRIRPGRSASVIPTSPPPRGDPEGEVGITPAPLRTRRRRGYISGISLGETKVSPRPPSSRGARQANDRGRCKFPWWRRADHSKDVEAHRLCETSLGRYLTCRIWRCGKPFGEPG